jgi:rRNA-processing protein FCF1
LSKKLIKDLKFRTFLYSHTLIYKMEAILDTNFIISCLRKRIDFQEELAKLGFIPLIPREVMQELKDLKNKKISREDKIAIDIALELMQKKKIKKISLGQGKVDEELIKKGKSGVYIATLDAAVKRSIPNKIVISSAQNTLLVERA